MLAGIPIKDLSFEQIKELLLWFGAGGLILVTICVCAIFFFRFPPWGRRTKKGPNRE